MIFPGVVDAATKTSWSGNLYDQGLVILLLDRSKNFINKQMEYYLASTC